MSENPDKRIGNRFWELRSKHGRDSLFKTPKLLWKAACEYFEWCEENPLIAIEFNGKDAVKCEIPKMRPFTLQGLCSYLGCNTDYFRQFKESETYKTKDFSCIVTRIEETIYNQKFTGASSGFLNANIIARDLGLADKKEMESSVHLTPDQLATLISQIED